MPHRSVALAAVLLAAGAARAEEYRNEQHHFSFRPPEGWVRIPAPLLNAMNEFTRQRTPAADVHFADGFMRPDADDPEPPYVLVQFTPAPTDRMTVADLKRAMAPAQLQPALDRTKEALKDVVRDFGPLGFTYDDAKGRGLLRFTMTGQNGLAVLGRTYVGVTDGGLVFLHAYSRAEDAAGDEATYAAVGESLRVDAGHAWVPAKRSVRVDWNRVPDDIIIGAAGASLGGVLWLAFALVKRRKRAKVDGRETSQ